MNAKSKSVMKSIHDQLFDKRTKLETQICGWLIMMDDHLKFQPGAKRLGPMNGRLE